MPFYLATRDLCTPKFLWISPTGSRTGGKIYCQHRLNGGTISATGELQLKMGSIFPSTHLVPDEAPITTHDADISLASRIGISCARRGQREHFAFRLESALRVGITTVIINLLDYSA